MKKILIVEDDEQILDLLGIIFEQAGFDPILRRLVLRVEEVLRLKPEAILLDVRISGSSITGDEFCKQLKANINCAEIPVILVSAERNLAAIAAACMADGFIAKPFDIDKIVKVVRKFVP